MVVDAMLPRTQVWHSCRVDLSTFWSLVRIIPYNSSNNLGPPWTLFLQKSCLTLCMHPGHLTLRYLRFFTVFTLFMALMLQLRNNPVIAQKPFMSFPLHLLSGVLH